ncbi:helix-turn-helix domain-containing protein [Sulfurospirillum barnesii]|uniref:DNA-binding domain-containing protein, AraC-type n=1 Tax=Sulfurospirillum barnesii (strain ATCC 700032 / DSM 10660 / SES-3) TaxID=760154 RepID=I3XVZ7_SULBS|nr:AraC family transcriptional regulator [Sulfurospirillum barnesii]AFL68121.1 DNA-binding domain-containing protein, AraC-type [Sulfurospirillum barnesii SES-3]
MIYYCKTAYADLEFIVLKEAIFSYPRHNHISSYTIGIVQNGALSLCSNGEKKVYKKDMSFTINPYDVHEIESLEVYDMIVLSLKRNFLKSYELLEAQVIVGRYARILEEMEYLEESHGALFDDILRGVYAHCDSMHEKHRTLDRIKTFLEEYPEVQIDGEHLSRYSALSKYHFIRKFDENVGMTPHKFHIQNRVRKAKGLIENSTSMTDVGLSAGFYDQSHFIRHFKKLFQISPSSYKAACLDLDALAKSGKKLR